MYEQGVGKRRRREKEKVLQEMSGRSRGEAFWLLGI
jgi:hypothetical protein